MSSKSLHSLLLRQINRFRRDASGNLAIIFGITAVPLLGLVSAAVDYSLANAERTKTQAVLDAAVLAGVQEATSSLQIAKASAFFTAQITNPWGTTPTATFSVDSSGTLSGVATGSVNAQFIKLAGIPTIPINVSSGANLKTVSTSTSTPSKVCILLVNPNASQSLLVNSGANLKAPNCEIDVDSTASTAAMINSPTALNVKKVCIKGTATQNGGTSAAVSTGCAAISNPFVGTLPTVSAGSCTVSNQNYSGSPTLSPGVYCGSFNFNGSGTVTFSPGLYILKGATMILNSGWSATGSGVTFYLADSSSTLQFNSNVTLNLSAPTSGTYANILMFEPDGLASSSIPIDGNSGSTNSLKGLIYLPSRNVTINSVSNANADNTTMVFSTLILDAMNWNVDVGAISMNGSSSSSTTSTTTLVHLTK